MDMEHIADGIKTRLQTIHGLRVFATKELPDTISDFPAALIMPGETEYVTSLASQDADYTFRIILVFSKADTPSAIRRMLPYIATEGDKSVVAAIHADSTLNGQAEDSKVMRNMGIGALAWAGTMYLSTEFLCQVWATND